MCRVSIHSRGGGSEADTTRHADEEGGRNKTAAEQMTARRHRRLESCEGRVCHCSLRRVSIAERRDRWPQLSSCCAALCRVVRICECSHFDGWFGCRAQWMSGDGRREGGGHEQRAASSDTPSACYRLVRGTHLTHRGRYHWTAWQEVDGRKGGERHSLVAECAWCSDRASSVVCVLLCGAVWCECESGWSAVIRHALLR